MDRISKLLIIAAVVGIPIGLLIPLGKANDALLRTLLCYVFAGVVFVLPLIYSILTEDPAKTRERLIDGDGDRRTSDVVVVGVGLASLVTLGVLLVGGRLPQDAKTAAAVIGLGVVAVGWLMVQSVYTLRYARIYYSSDDPPIDFNDKEDPALSDFAYFSYNLGMTYQVSDTDVKTRELRKVILAHTVLSYVYGTIVIATTVNLVVGFTSS